MTDSRTSNSLLDVAREVSTMDCFHTGGKCPPDCQCLSARAGRAVTGSAHEPEVRPSAWIRGVMHGGGPDGPPEYDEECSPGEDRPRGDNWVPLYTRPAPPPSVSRADLWRLAASAYKDGYGELPSSVAEYSDYTRDLVVSLSPTKGDSQ